MLDLNFIRDNAGLIKTVCENKNVNVNVDRFLELDKQRGKFIAQVEELRAERNQLAAKTKSKKPSEAAVKKGKDLKSQIEGLAKQLELIETNHAELWQTIPNVYSDDTPVGKDESANKVIRQWGGQPKFDFEPKPHWQLGTELDLIDSDRAGEVSGSRFSYLKNGAVRLQFALIQWVLEVLTSVDKVGEIVKAAKLDIPTTPFRPMIVPMIVKADVFAKSGRKDPVEDKYYLADDDSFLIGSAEHTLIAYHMGQVFKAEDLPIRYIGYSSAFRREAGSYGKDVRGILRQHQFDKLEMESFSTKNQGEDEQKLLVAVQEYLMQRLELAYQVVALSTGDMAKPDYRHIDIETWMPGEDRYRETHSADYVTDYQARRLNIKYQAEAGVKELVHMNDATAFAMGRTLIAIMENYQTQAGKVRIPEVLQPYLGGAKFL